MGVAEKREAVRERLIDAAVAAVAAGGMASVRVKDVATAAGCSAGQVYTFFDDVDALMVAVNSRTIRDLDSHLAARALKPGAAPPERVLVSLAFAYLEFADTRRRAWSALFERAAASGKPAPDWHREEHLALVRLAVDALRGLRPEWSDDQIGELALSMFSMVHGIVSIGLQETVVSVPVSQLDRQLDLVVTSLCRGLPD